MKPQFEVGPEHVGKGGVVRDDALRAEAADAVAREAALLGFEEVGRCDSRVAGPAGNREIFVRLRRRDPALRDGRSGGQGIGLAHPTRCSSDRRARPCR